MEFSEFVDKQADQLFEDIKSKLGDKWESLRDTHEGQLKSVSKYLAEYLYKSKAGEDVDPHLQVLEAIVQEYVAMGAMEAQSIIDAIVDAVKEHAKVFVQLLFTAAVKAGVEALKGESLEFSL
jgi:hypothetical protein